MGTAGKGAGRGRGGTPVLDSVNLQQKGGGRARWKARVDFYADVLLGSPAYGRLNENNAADVAPFWLGLHPFAGTARLFVSSAQVRRGQPLAPLHEAPWFAGVAELDPSRLPAAPGR